MPGSESSEVWRAECEAIHQEMERLVLSPWPRSQEENEVRKIQFAALIERRNEAAREFLAEATVQRKSKRGTTSAGNSSLRPSGNSTVM
jgi:hypothetical protein